MFKSVLILLPSLMASAALAQDFSLTSTDITGPELSQAQYANAFGCEGGNVSPELAWANPPAGTKSFVVTAYDPDAPTGSGWWHWTVANIPASVSELPSGAGSGSAALPEGAIMTNTDTGQPGFLGACPPVGTSHTYIFTVTALGVEKLDLPPTATPALLGFMAGAAKLGEAQLKVIGKR